jgi:hypothetical protein
MKALGPGAPGPLFPLLAVVKVKDMATLQVFKKWLNGYGTLLVPATKSCLLTHCSAVCVNCGAARLIRGRVVKHIAAPVIAKLVNRFT